MNKLLVAFAVVVMAASNFAFADAKGPTKKDAEDLVNSAIEFYKANGKDKAFSEISKKKGKFSKFDGKLYVFVYDTKGVVMAHGQNPQEIGINKMEAKDPNGTFYVKERITLTKEKGEGWQDYMFKDPETKKTSPKTSFVKKADDFIFGCGIYKK